MQANCGAALKGVKVEVWNRAETAAASLLPVRATCHRTLISVVD